MNWYKNITWILLILISLWVYRPMPTLYASVDEAGYIPTTLTEMTQGIREDHKDLPDSEGSFFLSKIRLIIPPFRMLKKISNNSLIIVKHYARFANLQKEYISSFHHQTEFRFQNYSFVLFWQDSLTKKLLVEPIQPKSMEILAVFGYYQPRVRTFYLFVNAFRTVDRGHEQQNF